MTAGTWRSIALALWGAAALALGAALVRTLRVERSYLPGSPPPRVEDRRAHHFRNFTYSQTERMLRHLVRQANGASTPRDRALALARVAALQQERGFLEPARAAGQEALQLTATDPEMQAEVRSILTQPLRLEDVLPPRSRDK